MSGKDKGVGEDYIFLMSIEEIKKMIHDHLEEQQISMINLSRRLDFTSNTIANFMLGKGMSVRFYRSLERYFGIDILKKIESPPAHVPEIIKEDEEEKEEAAEKGEKPKENTFLKPWMIQNLKDYGNTFVCNLSKKRSAKAVQEEFAKFGINVLVKENGVATLLRKGK